MSLPPALLSLSVVFLALVKTSFSTCYTPSTFTTCSVWNGQALHAGLAVQEAALERRARHTIAQFTSGDFGALNDEDRDYCGPDTSPTCCLALVDLFCRTSAFVMARERGFGLYSTPPNDAAWCSTTTTPSHEECSSDLNTCGLSVLDINLADPDPFSHAPDVPDVSYPGFVIPQRTYCELITGHGKPELSAAELGAAIEEERCDFADYVNRTDIARNGGATISTGDGDVSVAPLATLEDNCRTQIQVLRNNRFGPPSGWMMFEAVCKAACEVYFDVLSTIERRSGCVCERFDLQGCHHLDPNDHLCKWLEHCYDSTAYQEQNCLPTACGRTAASEADWRKCGAAASAVHLVAAFISLIMTLVLVMG